MSSQGNSFKTRFQWILIGSLSLLAVLGISIICVVNSIRMNVEDTSSISKISYHLLRSQSALRAFLLYSASDTTFAKTGVNEHYTSFENEIELTDKNIHLLKSRLSGKELEALLTVDKNIDEITATFKKISGLIAERGFINLGLEGKMREACHLLENSPLLPDKSVVLTMRKYEKDFFLRKDISYEEKFRNEASLLNDKITSLPASPEKEALAGAYKNYTTAFYRIVEIEKEIGLTLYTGLRKKINAYINSSIESLAMLSTTGDEKVRSLIVATIAFISVIFAVILLIALVAINRFIKPVFAPIHDIQKKAAEISEGNLSVDFSDLSNNRVLKELIGGFEKIIAKFKDTIVLVEGISSKKIKEELPVHSEKDEVGLTLNKIIVQIRKIDEEEKRRAWHNEGLARFATILRSHNENESALFDQIISEMVKYLNATQGALYVAESEGEKEFLVLKGCYAYNRKKYLDQKIARGEGMAGMCWIEGESIFMTDVPQNYVRITSGLGDANPRSIAIVPVKSNDEILGVIELASFQVFAPYQIKFMEAIAESIGSAIRNVKVNARTTILLRDSQEMTEILRAQEEEMRQNMEELQTTQEEMEKMSWKLRDEMAALQRENDELRLQLKEVAVK